MGSLAVTAEKASFFRENPLPDRYTLGGKPGAMKHDFTTEEQLVIENLKLKIQLAESQKQQAMSQLAVYTRDLMRKYTLPEESAPKLSASTEEIVAVPDTTPEPVQKVLSQAEAEAALRSKKGY